MLTNTSNEDVNDSTVLLDGGGFFFFKYLQWVQSETGIIGWVFFMSVSYCRSSALVFQICATGECQKDMCHVDERWQPPLFTPWSFRSVAIYLHFPVGDGRRGRARISGWAAVLGSGWATTDRLGVRHMPSAYHRSLMHEGDGDGQYPVPLEKRSQTVDTVEHRQEQEDAKDVYVG